VQGRKNFPDFSKVSGYKVWVHCASLGEFEQARPLIEKIKDLHPSCRIILSFFSPSGYEVRKNYPMADLVIYLPLDTKENAQHFIAELKPELALFVKYEFWFHFLNELNRQQIPAVLFSSAFRSNQIFFKWYGGLFRQMLQKFTHIFVQDEPSQSLLKTIGLSASIANDTRFDRVSAIAAHKTDLPLIQLFKGNSKLLIAGSTWAKDEKLLRACIKQKVPKGYKYIIAPHELEKERLHTLKRNMSAKTRFYSELNMENAAETDVVIIDNFGMLAALYSYGEIAYVGGAFNASVHNILEAAVYGVPVIFGPNFEKSLEAEKLIELKGAFAINDIESLQERLQSLSNASSLVGASAVCHQYVSNNKGGTQVIYQYLSGQKFLPTA
jgi:3-deoxy-D-manno-octulosonic-acid transferase